MQHVIVVIIVLAVISYFAYLIRHRLKGGDRDCNCGESDKVCGVDNGANCKFDFTCGSMMDSCGDCPLRQKHVLKNDKE